VPATAVAFIVLEKERLPAMLTFKESHSLSLRAMICFNDTTWSRHRYSIATFSPTKTTRYAVPAAAACGLVALFADFSTSRPYKF
jgi:hypothetical protein